MPADVVNIVQSFIRELESDQRQQGLVKAMIALLQELGHRVVAQGVENEAALAFLREAGCDEAQGYWFARPMETRYLPAGMSAGSLSRRSNYPCMGLWYRPTITIGTGTKR